jgi:sulfate transport system permease protein
MPVRGSSIRRPPLPLLGIGAGYVALLVVLPILVLVWEGLRLGVPAFLGALSTPEALFALRLTLLLAVLVAAIDAVTGTATAYVLARFRFPGRALVNAMVDLPVAIPTVVTGLMLVALYGPNSLAGDFLGRHGLQVIFAKPGILLALLYVTFPFVVRSVQPVVQELSRDQEEAAETLGASRWVTFKRVILPALRPAILAGTTLSFSRALGEFGSVVIVAGNIPMRTQVAPVYIYGEVESYSTAGAVSVSVVLLLASLLAISFLRRYKRSEGADA